MVDETPVTDIFAGGVRFTMKTGYVPDVSRDDPPISMGWVIDDDPGVAFIEALDLMTRTMPKHPWPQKAMATNTGGDSDDRQ